MSGGRGGWYVVVQGVLIAAALVAPALLDRAEFPAFIVVLGWLLCAAALVLLIAASRTLLRHDSLTPFPKPTDNAELVMSGVYSIVRHPIYSGLTLLALGWSLIWSSPPALVASLVLLVFFDIKSRREERWLMGRFEAYRSYRERVRRLIPYVY